jgi:DNA repair protein REV1
VEAFIHQMSEEVAHRLDAIGVKGRSLTLKVMQRDPAAPVEAPKVSEHTHHRSTSFMYFGIGLSLWDTDNA